MSVTIGNLLARAESPDGYGLRQVRLVKTGIPGEVIGTINRDLVRRHLWVALETGEDCEGTQEPTATAAVRWPLKGHIRMSRAPRAL